MKKFLEPGASRIVPAMLCVAGALVLGSTFAFSVGGYLETETRQEQVMLILPGVAGEGKPRGQLDDKAALEYARRIGYRGEVLDVAGNTGSDSPQVSMAIERIDATQKSPGFMGFRVEDTMRETFGGS